MAGHFNQIAQVLAESEGLSLHEAARLFALMNAATWDASLAAYKLKYAQPRWRPVTAIRSVE